MLTAEERLEIEEIDQLAGFLGGLQAELEQALETYRDKLHLAMAVAGDRFRQIEERLAAEEGEALPS